MLHDECMEVRRQLVTVGCSPCPTMWVSGTGLRSLGLVAMTLLSESSCQPGCGLLMYTFRYIGNTNFYNSNLIFTPSH